MASEMLLFVALPAAVRAHDARDTSAERHLLLVAEALEAKNLYGIEKHGSQDKPPISSATERI